MCRQGGSNRCLRTPGTVTLAKARHDRLRLLALPLSVVASTLVLAVPAQATGLEEPGCQPWICRPSTAGLAAVEGTVVRSASATGPFDSSQAGFAYRSVQFNREADGSYGEERLGPLRSVIKDAFKLSLPACSPANRVFGCAGGEYEGYATYDGRACSEAFYFFMTAGAVNQLPSTLLECVPRKPKQKHGKQAKRHR